MTEAECDSLLDLVQSRLQVTVSNLSVAQENLSAAQSRISDVDVANEMYDPRICA